MQHPTMQPGALSHLQNAYAQNQFDTAMTWNTTSFDSNAMMGGYPQQTFNVVQSGETDFSGYDPTEVEFHKYVQCNI